MTNKTISYLKETLIEFVFPRYCHSCKNQLIFEEEELCYGCLAEIDKTDNFQFTKNEITDLFENIIPIDHACSFLFFKKNGAVQKVLHALKYKRKKEAGIWLGEWIGMDIPDWLAHADAIVPVPIHEKKKLKRGYNQSEVIAEGIIKHVPLPILSHAVIKKENNTSQTNKNKSERLNNVRDVFQVINPELLKNKTIILLDDVITTGATLYTLAKTIKDAVPCKIRILVVASQPFL